MALRGLAWKDLSLADKKAAVDPHNYQGHGIHIQSACHTHTRLVYRQCLFGVVSEKEACGLGLPCQLWTTTPPNYDGGVCVYICDVDWDRWVMEAMLPGADRHVRDWIASFQERFGIDTR